METSSTKRGRPRCFEESKALSMAIEVFLKSGFEGVSLDELSKSLGINKPSLYAAFGNKEELFIKVLESYYAGYKDFFESLVEKELAPRQMIEEWLAWFIENFRNQENKIGCLIVNSTNLCGKNYPKITAFIKELHDSNESLLTKYFESQIESGQMPSDCKAKELSQFYNGIVQGMAVLRRSQQDLSALESIAKLSLKAWPAE